MKASARSCRVSPVFTSWRGERRTEVAYHGIDRCDACGRPLEQGQWLMGLCRGCEEAAKGSKGFPVETLKPTKGS